MCAILDADVRDEVFGGANSDAGKEFFNWIDGGSGRLVVGGANLTELMGNATFGLWRIEAEQSGRLIIERNDAVERRTTQLKDEGECKSNDPHVVALGQVSGARLLFSNDKRLHRDFRNSRLINKPRGRVYSTREKKDFDSAKRRLLTENVCCVVS